VPRLSLDRPFTYLLPDDADAGVGSLVSVPFHGRNVKAYVLGPAAEVPEGRLSTVKKVLSPVRFFDQRMLTLLRWVSERYIAPLSTVIDRSHPPRVVSEEKSLSAAAVNGRVPPRSVRKAPRGTSPAYAPPPDHSPFADGSVTWVRPLPGREAEECMHAVRQALAAGRRAIVLVPEAEPVPFTAAAVLEEIGDRAVSFLGGDARERYRTWLAIQSGQHDVVVGTRPAVFAPVADLGLLWISREVHPGHREDRSPYYRVADVAAARAELEEAACVIASLSPSVETAAGIQSGAIGVRRPARQAERAAAPLVETAAPEGEDRSPRLAALLKRARSAALIVSRSGYGVARVCRSCGQAAACDQCGGPIVSEHGATACRACGAPGRCANCGGTRFGIERAGTERILEWVRSVGNVPAALAEGTDEGPAGPTPGSVLVGTAAAVNDAAPPGLDLVAILDPDRALVRPGIRAGERALATWMEAAAWARSRSEGGRVLAQTRRPGHPAIQALVRWDPTLFLLREAEERRLAGFPPNHPVYRIEGTGGLEGALAPAGPQTMLTSPRGDGTVCLVAVRPDDLPAFRAHVLRLATEGTVTRVEAEPQI
jgi:primosomal protein N' (replication factor Y)